MAINPYRRLPIYTNNVISKYQGKRKTEMPPHLFSVADNAYRNMLQGTYYFIQLQILLHTTTYCFTFLYCSILLHTASHIYTTSYNYKYYVILLHILLHIARCITSYNYIYFSILLHKLLHTTAYTTSYRYTTVHSTSHMYITSYYNIYYLISL